MDWRSRYSTGHDVNVRAIRKQGLALWRGERSYNSTETTDSSRGVTWTSGASAATIMNEPDWLPRNDRIDKKFFCSPDDDKRAEVLYQYLAISVKR